MEVNGRAGASCDHTVTSLLCISPVTLGRMFVCWLWHIGLPDYARIFPSYQRYSLFVVCGLLIGMASLVAE